MATSFYEQGEKSPRIRRSSVRCPFVGTSFIRLATRGWSFASQGIAGAALGRARARSESLAIIETILGIDFRELSKGIIGRINKPGGDDTAGRRTDAAAEAVLNPAGSPAPPGARSVESIGLTYRRSVATHISPFCRLWVYARLPRQPKNPQTNDSRTGITNARKVCDFLGVDLARSRRLVYSSVLQGGNAGRLHSPRAH